MSGNASSTRVQAVGDHTPTVGTVTEKTTDEDEAHIYREDQLFTRAGRQTWQHL